MAEAHTSESQSSPVPTERMNQVSSASGEVLTVSDSIFKHSFLLSTMRSVLDSENECEPFPLPSVSTDCLRIIIKFVESYPTLMLKEIEKEKDYSRWGNILFTLSTSNLREMLLACNYMDTPVLMYVVTRTLGERFRDTPLEDTAEMVEFRKPGDNPVRREYLNDLVVHFLPHSMELCMMVLDFAEVWNCTVVRTDLAFKKQHCKEMYLRISVPNIPMSKGPRKLEISVDSHDQGWSSYPHHANTRQNSWTWGEVWVSNSQGEALYKDHVYRNLHACGQWELQHKTFDRYTELLSHIKPGVNVDLMLCAEFPGWMNSTRFAEMKLYFL